MLMRRLLLCALCVVAAATSLTAVVLPPKEWIEDWIGTFADTGTVHRAKTVGDASRWMDSTGVVWKVVSGVPVPQGEVALLPQTVTHDKATNVVRSILYSVGNYVWDGDVCWRRDIVPPGHIEFIAVTNIDLTAPENAAALEAVEAARRMQ